MMTRGGYAVYGEDVGVLVLDTRFPRIHGDIANARTFPFPIRYKVVPAATQAEIVATADRARNLLPDFIAAARQLEKEGVKAITTTCGFLTVVQEEIAEAVTVPVVTSSLFLVPLIRAMVGNRTIGIVTANAASLSERHLSAAGIVPDGKTVLCGLEDSAAFRSAILETEGKDVFEIDVEAVEKEVVAACRSLREAHPDLSAIVFECTNLQPFAEAVQRETGLPVFGIFHLVQMLQSGVRAPRFDSSL